MCSRVDQMPGPWLNVSLHLAMTWHPNHYEKKTGAEGGGLGEEDKVRALKVIVSAALSPPKGAAVLLKGGHMVFFKHSAQKIELGVA